MGIIQKNLYLPGQDLTNLAQNVDYNRYQDFKGNITVDFGTVPATVTVKVGTILEVNGNLYAIETADYVFAMDNATHNYLTFTDNPAVDFGSAAAIGTYTAAKQGYYQAGNLIRTLPFYINQTSREVSRLMDEQYNLNRPRMKLFDRIYVTLSANLAIGAGGATQGTIPFDTEIYDELGNYNTGTYTFTVSEAGWYLISLTTSGYIAITAQLVNISCAITVNGTEIAEHITVSNDSNPDDTHRYESQESGSSTIIYYLKINDAVTFKYYKTNGSAGTIYKLLNWANARATHAMIQRII